MNNVMTNGQAKNTQIQIRVRSEVKEDLRILADYKGVTVSALIHMLVIKTIREEKELTPDAFVSERNMNGKILAPKSRTKIPMKKEKTPQKKVA